MSVKIKVSLEAIEFEYEGSEEFLSQNLDSLLETLSQVNAKNASPDSDAVNSGQEPAESPVSTPAVAEMSTGTIAAKLNCESGPDLVIAAAAHLALILSKDTFSRQEILDDMRSATSYYKETYRKHLSESLKVLIRDNKLMERSSGVYALSAKAKQDLQTVLS